MTNYPRVVLESVYKAERELNTTANTPQGMNRLSMMTSAKHEEEVELPVVQ